MSLTWHVIAKDLSRMRLAILAWVGLMALKILFYASVSGVFGSPSLPWLIRLGEGPETMIRGCTEPLIAFVLVGWMVFEDPLAGSDVFWVTRPISGARLLAAKVLCAALLFVALPVAINVPWWLASGFSAGQVAHAAIILAAEYSAIVIVGMGVASATTSFPRYFLWTIAGLAGIGIVHFVAAEINQSGLGFRSTQEIGTGLALTRACILLACALLVPAEIAAYQFLSRHFRRSLPAVVAVTVALSATVFVSPLNLFPHFGWDAQAVVLGYASPARPDSKVGVSMPSGPTHQPLYDGYLSVPMRITGLSPGMAAFWQTQAEWSENGKTLWKVGGLGGRAQVDLMREKMGSLVGFTKDVSDFDCDDYFPFPRKLAQRYEDKTLSFRAKVYLYLLRGAVAVDAPVADGSFRQTGASFSVSELARDEHGVRLTATDRFERANLLATFGLVWPRSITWALVNRTRGEMRVGKQDLGSDPVGLQLNMVSVVSERIAIGDVPSQAWLDGATLVAFDFSGDHNVERSMTEDHFHFTYRTPEESRFRSNKAR